MESSRVFIAGGTGYMAQRLIRELLVRGHEVTAVVRAGSESKLPPCCVVVKGNVLDGDSYVDCVSPDHTFIQLVGVAHPSPAKAKEFVEIDERSALEAIRISRAAGVRQFVYVSVAHPAPAMHAYVAVRSRCEAAIHDAGTNATILRPWYVLGPGHQWPRLLIPMYWLAERIPSTRDGARRLGLVTIAQMVAALVNAVEKPARGIEIVMFRGFGAPRSHNCGKCARILLGAFLRSRWRPIIFDPTLKNEGVGPRASVRWSLPVTPVDGP